MIGGIYFYGLTSGGGIEVDNGTIQNYYSASGTIEIGTFVEITNGYITTATSKIDGVTKTQATTTNAGQVYVIGSGS